MGLKDNGELFKMMETGAMYGVICDGFWGTHSEWPFGPEYTQSFGNFQPTMIFRLFASHLKKSTQFLSRGYPRTCMDRLADV